MAAFFRRPFYQGDIIIKWESLKPIVITLLREVLSAMSLLFGVSLVAFLIIYNSPGDPFASLLSGVQSESAKQEIRDSLGIAATWYGQYFSWLGNMLVGDFGTSISTGQSVLDYLLQTSMSTLYLTIGALSLALFLAVPIASYSALRRNTLSSWLLNFFAYSTSAIPIFWLGYLVIYFFTHKLGLFPISVGKQQTGFQIVLPILVLAIGSGVIGEVVRQLQAEIERVLGEEYIRTARAKGASIWKHAFKEAYLLPVTEIIAAKIPFLLGGAIIVEQVFAWPGMGRMAWQAALNRDFPLILGVVIFAAIFVRFGSLIHKTVYVMVNPRASHQK